MKEASQYVKMEVKKKIGSRLALVLHCGEEFESMVKCDYSLESLANFN